MEFSKFNLDDSLLQALNKNNFLEATSIQEKVIPLVLQKHDLIVQAQTGSGKTASFVLPILQTIINNKKSINPNQKSKIKALIITPTRELSLQVSEVFKSFFTFIEKKTSLVTLIGGESLGEQLSIIQQGCDIVVATSGRLLDILSKKQLDLSNLEFFVLDEADKMLNAGFEEELNIVLKSLPLKRQNLLFSATYSSKVMDIASLFMSEYKEVKIEEEIVVDKIQQRVIEVNQENRSPLLRYLLKTNEFKQVLVFVASQKLADNLGDKFRAKGFKADSFHGSLTQEERVYTLNEFKAKDIDILFCTDIAARGLHLENISCVINYDLPRSPNDYVHRIGRTARAGKSGMAISFIGHEEQDHFNLIEKRSNIKLLRESIEGFELKGQPIKRVGKEAIKGKRKSKKDKLRELALKNNKDS